MRDENLHLRISPPVGEPPIGVSTLTVDLGAFLATAREVGFDAGLLLLTMRALAVRSGGRIPVKELSWVLGARFVEIIRWLVALEGAGLCVWHSHGATVSLEISSMETERTLFGPDDAPGVLHRLPVFWFSRTLPLLGRRAFLTYLYLRSHERLAGITEPLTIGSIGRSTGQSPREVEASLRRLQRHHLTGRVGRFGKYVLTDPPPLSAYQRWYLKWLAAGAIPATPRDRLRLLAWILVPTVVVALLLTAILL